MESMNEEQKKLKLENQKWKNRRKMAWISYVLLLIVTAAIALKILNLVENVEVKDQVVIAQLISSLIWLAGFHASIVLGYLGLATAKEIKAFKYEQTDD